ncbi:hypothetical protein FTUN_8097 [Frigoriglobus tundricola]|uniref:Uncharacterized protein n=1 Tax=Frigoriglobus tundricola TaxID=2774151 RepID=A0A6M5Z3W9_9BACT|nr:hypothetical protein FTUN_8097 [Frigoriglobus tundricola]
MRGVCRRLGRPLGAPRPVARSGTRRSTLYDFCPARCARGRTRDRGGVSFRDRKFGPSGRLS